MSEQLFGDENSPLRESPQFRRCMEQYKFLDEQIEDLQTRRGVLSYEDTLKLTKLKKLKLAARDEMESWKRKVE